MRSSLRRGAVGCLFLTLPLLGCQTAPEPGPQPGDCDSYTFTHATPTTWSHTATCSDVCGNGENPPTGGPHCSAPLACRVYAQEQARCQWIHNLEHGHVVLAYHCPGGCPEIVASLESVRQGLAVGSNGVPPALVTPDSQLPKKVAV